MQGVFAYGGAQIFVEIMAEMGSSPFLSKLVPGQLGFLPLTCDLLP